MWPLINLLVWCVPCARGVHPNFKHGTHGKRICIKGLVDGVYRVYPEIKFQAEEYKNTTIIGHTAPYIGFGRKGCTRYTRKRNRLFFLNNWCDTRSSQGTHAAMSWCTRAINPLKSLIFSNPQGYIRHASL